MALNSLLTLCLFLALAGPLVCFDDQCDLLVFSYNRPMQIYAFLESAEKLAVNIHKVFAICRIDPPYERGYAIVHEAFPYVQFLRQSRENPKADFKPLVMETLFGNEGRDADYILFAVDDIILTDTFDVKEGMAKLRECGAYGLFYRLGPHIDHCYVLNRYQGVPRLRDVGDGYFSWQFKKGRDDWSYPNTVDLTLYAKKDLKNVFHQIDFTYPNDFEGHWMGHADCNKIGLCCNRAKMINIPMNIVSEWKNRAAHFYSAEQLNLLFLKGMKIDIEPFFRILNHSCHVDYKPTFIRR